MMGSFALATPSIGRIPAQSDVTSNNAFAWPIVAGMLIKQANPSSTENGLQVQNRYPSPLKRSAFAGRPLFFGQGLKWRLGAEVARQICATSRRKPGKFNYLHEQTRVSCSVSSKHNGGKSCAKFLFSSPQPLRLRRVTTTRNAALWAPGLAPRSQQPRAAVSRLARSWVESQGSSATTWASASNLKPTNLTNWAGMRARVSALFASQDFISRGT